MAKSSYSRAKEEHYKPLKENYLCGFGGFIPAAYISPQSWHPLKLKKQSAETPQTALVPVSTSTLSPYHVPTILKNKKVTGVYDNTSHPWQGYMNHFLSPMGLTIPPHPAETHAEKAWRALHLTGTKTTQ